MNNTKILDSLNLDISKLTISEPNYIDNKKYMSMICYDNEDYLLKSDKFKIIDIEYVVDGFILELEFLQESNNLYLLLKDIEDHIKKTIAINSLDWFGIELDIYNIDSNYKSILNLSKTLDTLPTIRLFVPDETYVCDIDNNKVSLINEFDTLNELIMLFTIDTINFVSSKIHIELKPHTIKLLSNKIE
jgi:hypothetical protein